MFIKGHQIMILTLVLLLLFTSSNSVNAVESRKLDETPVPATNGTEQKCGSCGGTTYPSPPPPPPPSPPPKKPKPSPYCPPPPSSFIYITGPPGNLYPVDENFSGATGHRRNLAAALPLLLAGLFSMLAFW